MAGEKEKAKKGQNQDAPGICIDSLARLPEKAILDERRLASELGVTSRTIRRMVGRFELPPPVRFGGKSVWFAGKVLEHLEKQAEQAAKEAEKQQRKISQLLP